MVGPMAYRLLWRRGHATLIDSVTTKMWNFVTNYTSKQAMSGFQGANKMMLLLFLA